MQNQQINDLASQIHEERLNRGFYENAPSKIDTLIECQSCLFKAYEVRNTSLETPTKITGRLEVLMADDVHPKMSNSTFHRLYKTIIENTIQSKMAECVILLLDYAAFKKITIEKLTHEFKAAKFAAKDFKTILLDLTAAFQVFYDMKMTEIELSDLVFYIEEFAKFNNFDIWQQVKFKLFYDQLNNANINSRKNVILKR